MHHRRIIPAHAGFTSPSDRRHAADGDHPRTRGVYQVGQCTPSGAGGSSPHTRGLPPQHRASPAAPRIIPAHAGFTTLCRGHVSSMQDHPRTRGVYVGIPANGHPVRGSSPHTRGLPLTGQVGDHHAGIIPAHAGFTVNHSTTGAAASDHPRTRGVYPRKRTCDRKATGSSPHTRGLQTGLPVGDLVCRIIPAHAGFTWGGAARGGCSVDHPRTRGVYLRAVACVRRRVWIIPAHAGFTSSSTPPTRSRTDHPRTRGVYAMIALTIVLMAGSSPHTRGLLLVPPVLVEGDGIIPAHAGFTRPAASL